jgi:4'-phosphopantetheinyl transferase
MPRKGVVIVVADLQELSAARRGALAATLTGSEHERARRFRRAADAERFVLTRGLLRERLATLLATDPRAIRLAYGVSGKPELSGGELRFNVAHSGRYAAVATSCEREIGVDVEAHRDDLDIDDLAARFFAAPERAALARAPAPARARAFFACWTRKEAVLKAMGHGLGWPLDAVEVTVGEGREPAVVHEPGRWTLRDLPIAAGYAGAVAVRGAGVPIAVEREP